MEAIALVTGAVERYKRNIDVILYGCWCLVELASGEDDDIDAESSTIVDSVLGAMQRHVKKAEVIRYGAKVLENLAYRSRKPVVTYSGYSLGGDNP